MAGRDIAAAGGAAYKCDILEPKDLSMPDEHKRAHLEDRRSRLLRENDRLQAEYDPAAKAAAESFQGPNVTTAAEHRAGAIWARKQVVVDELYEVDRELDSL